MSKGKMSKGRRHIRISDCSIRGSRREIKRWRRQRVNNGFAFIDAVCMSEYLAWVITGMLDFLAAHSIGYPGWPIGDPIGGSYEGWTAFLRSTSDKIKRAQRLVEDDLEAGADLDRIKQWTEEYEKRTEEADKLIQEAFTDLGKWFFRLGT